MSSRDIADRQNAAGYGAMPVPRARFARAAAGVASLVLSASLFGCGPSQSEIDAAKAAVAEHTELLRVLPEFRMGQFQIHEIEYVNQSNSIAAGKGYVINIVVIQNDQDPNASRVMTRPEQILKKPKEFYTRFLCPPRGLVAPYLDTFDFNLKLVSRQFGQLYRIPCDFSVNADAATAK